MHGKIALEEHFAIPETLTDSAGFVPANYWPELKGRLLDIQDKRLRQMDEQGIEMMILSLNAPAVQAIPDARKANEIAVRANDYLAEEVAKRPGRFQAFAALPMQDPDMAIAELDRAVMTLGFRGALVNGFSQVGDAQTAAYYDLDRYWPFWAKVEQLDVPFYLHPRNPLASDSRIYEGHEWLLGPTWAFGQETAVHALRLMGSGLFDQYPGLRIILGPHGRRASLQHVAHRSSQRLGEVAAAIQGQEKDLRVLQSAFLSDDIRKFPYPDADRRLARDRQRSNPVLRGLAVREYRSRRAMVRQRNDQRGRPAKDRAG